MQTSTETPEAAHHEHGPSSLNYKRVCPAFRNRPGTSDAAEEGELLHRAVETGYDDALDPEQVELVDKVRSFVNGATVGEDVYADHREIRLNVRLNNGHDTFGTCDRLMLLGTGRRGLLIDYKFGRLAVPAAEDNLQGMAYAVGVFQLFPKVDKLDVIFLLPRRDEVSRAKFTREKLDEYVGTLTDLFDQITAEDPTRRANKACEYCAHAASCLELAKVTTSVVSVPGELVPPTSMDVSLMSAEDIDRFALPMSRLVTKWAEAVKARALELLSSGTEMENHGLQTRRMPRKLLGPITEAWELCEKLGLPLDAFQNSCTLSVAQLLKEAKRAKLGDITDQLIEAGFLSHDNPTYKTIKRK